MQPTVHVHITFKLIMQYLPSADNRNLLTDLLLAYFRKILS